MNVELFANVKLRRFFLLAVSLCLLLVMIRFMMLQYLSRQLDQNREQITTLVKQELGFPITYDGIRATMSGYHIGIVFKNVAVQDPHLQMTVLSADSIKVLPDIKAYLFDNVLKPKKIIFVRPKLMLDWDGKTKISIKGLQGQLISNSLKDSTLLQQLDLQTLQIEQGEIDWQGPNLKIKQFINGKFKWLEKLTSAESEANILPPFIITGNHQLQIREGQLLPESEFKIEAAKALETITVEINAKGLKGNCRLNAPDADKPWLADCSGKIKYVDIAKIRDYYVPQKSDPKLLQWLTTALVTGYIHQGNVQVTGPFNALNWEGELAYTEVDLHYSSDWPNLEQAEGVVKVSKDKIVVDLQYGTIQASEIIAARALIEPILDKPSVVSINGTINSTLELGLQFLKNTPLKKSVAQSLTSLDLKGPMDLALNLTIPLDSKVSNSVLGTIKTEAAHLKLPDTETMIEQLTGTFQFTEKSLAATNVTGVWLQHPLKLTLETALYDKVNWLSVTAEGTFSSHFLQQHWKFALLDKLQGETHCAITFHKPLLTTTPYKEEWALASNLEGMAIDLPEPLKKSAPEKRDLNVSFQHPEKDERKIAVNYGKVLDMKVVVKTQDKKLKVKRGHIVLGAENADWTSVDSLLIGGDISSLNASEWLEYLSQNVEKTHLPSLELHLLVHKLDMYGILFNETWLTTNSTVSSDQWGFDGPNVRGRLIFPQTKGAPLKIELEYLKIAANNAETKTTFDFNSQAKYPVSFYCKDLQYQQGHFGETSFTLSPRPYGYAIEDFSLGTNASELAGQGEWHITKAGSRTEFQGKLSSNNMSKLFSDWGFPSAIREAQGTVRVDLHWPQNPFGFNASNIEGTASLRLTKGRILGVNPGLGRVMGLLSEENISRRLQFDFKDVTKKGFLFDTLKADFQLHKGIASTDLLLIDGPAAKITLKGTANLQNKMVDLEMGVTPHVGSGIPLAAAALVTGANPVLGAGVWVLDKITGSNLSKITGKIIQNRYHVTGTWDAPHMQEVGKGGRE